MRLLHPPFILFSQLESEPGKSAGIYARTIDALVQRPECDVILIEADGRVECR